MSNPPDTYLYHRKCKLDKIKECPVTFHTNRKNKMFCCDKHRYKWHNNIRSLFKRMSLLEKTVESIMALYVDGKRIM